MTRDLQLHWDRTCCLVLTCGEPGACWHCGIPTCWADLAFMVYLHPGACSTAKWREYDEAERAAARAERAAGAIPISEPF